MESQIGRKIVPNCCSSDCEVPSAKCSSCPSDSEAAAHSRSKMSSARHRGDRHTVRNLTIINFTTKNNNKNNNKSTRRAQTSSKANMIRIRSPYPEYGYGSGLIKSGSGELPKFNGDFLVRSCICGKILEPFNSLYVMLLTDKRRPPSPTGCVRFSRLAMFSVRLHAEDLFMRR